MPNIATITNNIISALSGTTSQVLLGDATLTDFKLDSLTDVNVPTPGDGDVLRWNATTSLWEASDAAGITGSGTTNYIAKFTSGGVIGSSLLFDNGTNIGIGTATPIAYFDNALSARALQIVGNGRTGINLQDSSAVNQYLNIGVNGANAFIEAVYSTTPTINYNAYSTHIFITGSTPTEKMRLTSIGRLGIGTTAPTQTLHVQGTFRSYFDAFNYIILDGTDLRMSANSAIIIGDNSTDSVTIGAATGETRPTLIKGGPISLMTSGLTRVTVAQNGDVGIGTASPTYKLHVAGTLSANAGFSTYVTDGVFGATATPSVINLPNSNNRIIFGYATSGDGIYHGRIGILSNGAGKVSFGAAASSTFTIGTGDTEVERLRIDASGTIGIGVVPSAWQTFTGVQFGEVGSLGANDFGSANLQTFLGNNVYYDNTGFKYIMAGTAAMYRMVQNIHQWHIAATGAANGSLTFTQAMTLNADGRLGIGTTSPQTALDVAGSFRVSGTGGTGFFTGSNVILETPITWGNIGGSAFQIRNTTSLGLVFGAATSQLMTLTTGGNLGIGITAPIRKFQINEGSANTVGIAITNSSSTVNGLQLLVDGAGGTALWNYSNTELAFGTNNTERIRITNAGNVGIGTTAPTAKFGVKLATATAVSTMANITGWDSTYAVFGNPESGTAQGYAIGIRNSLDGVNLLSLNPASDWVDTNYYSRNHIFYGGESERLRITVAGNVGIGTTNPIAKFDVRGNSTGALTIVSWFSDSSVNQNALAVRAGTGRIDLLASWGGTGIATDLTFTPTTLAGVQTEAMRITSTGNVGIGTTAPAHKLDVVGTSRFDGTQRIINSNNLRFTKFSIDSTTFADIWFSSTTDSLQISSVTNSIKIGGGTPAGFTEYIGIASGGATTFSADATINGVRVGRGPNNLAGNIVLGTNALNGVTTGGNNTAIGAYALRGTTTGTYNIAIGPSAGGIGVVENTTGSLNIFIGAECQGESATDSNRTWIGSQTTTSTWLAGNLLLGSKSNTGERIQVTGTMKVTGASNFGTTVTFNGSTTYNAGAVIRSDNGTAAAPSISFDSDLNTGIYRISNDILGFTTNGIEKMRIDANGNVGIGTSTPGNDKLSVVGTGRFTAGLTSSTAFIQYAHYFYNGGGTNDIFASTTGNNAGSGNFAIVNTVDGSRIALLGSATGTVRIGNNTQTAATATAFVVDLATNYVGIGTATPKRHLDVSTTGSPEIVLGALNGATDQKYWRVYTANDVMRLGYVNDAFSSAADVLNINRSGNVGIGTSSPTNILTLLKNQNATTALNVINTNVGTDSFSGVQLGSDIAGGTAYTSLVYATSGVTTNGAFRPNGTTLANYGAGGLNLFAQSQPIRFFTGSGTGTQRLTILDDGKVGINTSSPNSNFEVSGSISRSITTKTAAYTLTDLDYTVVGNTNLSAFTFTLPTAVGRTGRIYVIKNAVGGNILTVDGNGSETIDGYLTYGLSCQSGIIIQSDGANWYVIADIADTSCFVTP